MYPVESPLATIVQHSKLTYVNLDMATVLRYQDNEWHLYFTDHAHSLALTPEETVVLALYLRNHTERATYHAWLHVEQVGAP